MNLGRSVLESPVEAEEGGDAGGEDAGGWRGEAGGTEEAEVQLFLIDTIEDVVDAGDKA